MIKIFPTGNGHCNFFFLSTTCGIVHKEFFRIIAEDIANISAGVITHFKNSIVGLVKCGNKLNADKRIIHTGF